MKKNISKTTKTQNAGNAKRRPLREMDREEEDCESDDQAERSTPPPR